MSYESFIRPGEAIQPAIDRASRQGGGKVSLLPGTHRTGTLYLKSNVELFLACGAVLEGGHTEAEYDALPDPLFAECHTDAHNRALLAAANAENIALTGYGVIEGNGPDFYEKKILPCGFYQRKQVERPRMLHFANCRNIRIENLHFHNSPRWTMWFIQCCDLVIRGVEIFGDPRMINNDGIHFFGGRNLMVSDCRISTGDDALVVRAGHAWHANTNRVILEDLVVTNCVLESACQAIRVGCPGDDLIRNCRFSNLVLKGKNGIFFDNPRRYWERELATPFRQSPHEVHHLAFSAITISVSGCPLAVSVEEGVEIGLLDDLLFSDLLLEGGEPLRFCGRSALPLGRIVLNDVRGTIYAPEPLLWRNVRLLSLNRVELVSAV